MNIALHVVDNTGFPNLALMKLSMYHKQAGDSVEWFWPLYADIYDKVYSSSVFSFNEAPNTYLPLNTIKGGTGYGQFNKLPQVIDNIEPDYSLYNIDYSVGFLTRGCPNKCTWCVVPDKEGGVHAYRTVSQVCKHDKVCFMDNNVLASDFGIEQLQELGKMNVKVDFNQGLDARLLDDRIAEYLSKIKWWKPLRLACDSQNMKPYIERAVALLRRHNVTPSTYFCYVLVTEDIEEAIDRVGFCRALKIDPFAQPYRDFNKKTPITREQKHFARWVNHKAVFKTVTWEEYLKGKTE